MTFSLWQALLAAIAFTAGYYVSWLARNARHRVVARELVESRNEAEVLREEARRLGKRLDRANQRLAEDGHSVMS